MKYSELFVKLDLQSERKQHGEMWLSASSNNENKIMSSGGKAWHKSATWRWRLSAAMRLSGRGNGWASGPSLTRSWCRCDRLLLIRLFPAGLNSLSAGLSGILMNWLRMQTLRMFPCSPRGNVKPWNMSDWRSARSEKLLLLFRSFL